MFENEKPPAVKKISGLGKGTYSIYLDHNSSTFTSSEVLEEMLPFFDQHYGNPSSVHSLGLNAGSAIKSARRLVADLIKASSEEIVFTSGGTESNNLALFGYLEKFKGTPIHIITSAIEHPSISEVCRKLAGRPDVEVSHIPVNIYGRVDLRRLENGIRENTKLISVVAVDSIIGAIQDLDKIGALAKKHSIAFHTDAALAAGKIPLDVNRSGVDMLSLSSHKMYGPKGIGALFVRKNVMIDSLIYGGGQEHCLRSGTENVPGIVGFGKAAYIARQKLDDFHAHTRALRSKFVALVKHEIDHVYILSHEKYCVPSTLNISFKEAEAEMIVKMLSYYGIGASTSEACGSAPGPGLSASKSGGDAHVLAALGLSPAFCMGAVRFSFGFGVRERDIEHVVGVLKVVVEKLRSMHGNEIKTGRVARSV